MCSQNPIQWVPTTVSPGVKRPDHATDQTGPFNAENNKNKSYTILPLSVIPSWSVKRQSCLHRSPILENPVMVNMSLCCFDVESLNQTAVEYNG
jgi:hypothetical protein